MTTIRAAAVALLLSTILGACVGGAGAPSLGTVANLKAERTIPDAGITMSPPSVGQQAKASAADALKVCGTTASCPAGPASAELAIVTDSQAATVDGAGTMTPVMDHRLVWVLSWTNIECTHSGPGPLPGQSIAPRTGPCDVTTFVDADTGADIYTLSQAHQ